MTARSASPPGGAPSKVVLLTHYLLPHKGGIEIVAEELAGSLLEHGVAPAVTMIAARVPPDSPAREIRGGLEKLRVRASNPFEERFAVPWPLLRRGELRRAIRGAAPAGALLHAHGLLYQVSLAAAREARRLGVPFVVTEHVGEIPYPDPFRRFLQRIAFGGPGGLVARRADLLCLQTPRLLAEAERWTRGETAVALVRAGLDSTLFRPPLPGERERLRAELGWSRPVVLFVGRPTPRKGLPLLEAAIASFPRDERPLLVVVGSGSATADAAFRELPRERLAELYRAADLFVLPSRGEGFPVSAQEALLSALPVVIGEDPGIAAEGGRWLTEVRPTSQDVARAIAAELPRSVESRGRLEAERPAIAARWSREAVARLHGELYAAASFFRQVPRAWSFAALDLSAKAKHPILRAFLSPIPARGLDVGIGTGYGAAALLGPRFFGIDAVLGNLLYARRLARSIGGEPRLVLADGARLPFRDGAFDAVLSSEVLEHLEDDRSAAAELARVTAPGGKLAVTTPSTAMGFPGYLEAFGVETVHDRPGPERHVRPGYDEASLDGLFAPHGCRPERREWFLRVFGKAAADAVAAAHLLHERLVHGRREWTWSEAAQSESSLAVRVYAKLFPLFGLALRLDRLLPRRLRGFQIATLYRKDGA